jgi:hypothetical protein
VKTITKLWIGIAILIVLSPIGLILPEYFKAEDAWGEWGSGTVKELVGYIPQGFKRLSSLWSAPISDYAFKSWQEKPITSLSLAYIASAFIGILACVGVVLLLGKVLSRKE